MGKRNLESAIAALPPSAPAVSVGWKPFFLRPNMPLDGVDKGPGNRVNPRLKQAGANVGIDFTGLTDRYPNTVKGPIINDIRTKSASPPPISTFGGHLRNFPYYTFVCPPASEVIYGWPPKAHTLLAFAERDAGRETQNKLQEILFRHYFTDGRYPDEANLRAAAVEAGLDPERAMAAVADQGRDSMHFKILIEIVLKKSSKCYDNKIARK